jgi:hypothetical protein
VETELTNEGPDGPTEALLRKSVVAPPQVAVQPATREQVEAGLAVGAPRVDLATYRVACLAPGRHVVRFRSEVAPNLPFVVDPDPADDAGEAALLVDCATPVAINVEPGSASNPIQLQQEAVPVAVLTTTAGEYALPAAFDATRIDAATARLGTPGLAAAGAGAPIRHVRGHVEDALERDEVTRDGDADLVLHFRASETGLAPGGSEVCLRGEYLTPAANPATFYGCDGIRVGPPSP